MTTRAIHRKSADRFFNDKCVKVIRCCIALNGLPQKKNLGQEYLFHRSTRKLGWIMKKKRRNAMTNHSHFGSAWEKLILMFKRAFLLRLGSGRLIQDFFSTIAIETEGSIRFLWLIWRRRWRTKCYQHPITCWQRAPFLAVSNAQKLMSDSWK